MGAFLATVGKKIAEKAAEREVNKKTGDKKRGPTQIDMSTLSNLAGSVPGGDTDLTDATRRKRSNGKRSD